MQVLSNSTVILPDDKEHGVKTTRPNLVDTWSCVRGLFVLVPYLRRHSFGECALSDSSNASMHTFKMRHKNIALQACRRASLDDCLPNATDGRTVCLSFFYEYLGSFNWDPRAQRTSESASKT